MQSRQCGAAHINIFYFLVMLVLFLGAMGFGYLNLTQAIELEDSIKSYRAENRQLKVDLQVRDHYIEDIVKTVGEAGTYNGRDSFVYVDPDDANATETVKPLENVALPANIVASARAFASQAQIPESQATPLNALFTQAKQKLDAKDQRIADLTTQNTTVSTQLAKASSDVSEANQQKSTAITKLTTEKDELRQYIDSTFNTLKNDNNTLRQEVRSRQEELDTATEAHGQQVAELKKEINVQKAVIDARRRLTELINPPQEPDGAVISSSATVGKAWINLGRKDMLPRGTVFQISAPNRSGIKGYGRVIRLLSDRAEIELYDVADRYDPIIKGDLVRNDLYSPSLRRNIFLMGRFSYPMTKPIVRMALEKLGNKVHDKIGPGVDLIIVGDDTVNEEGDGFTPVTDTAEYKAALALGIEIATLNKVRDFLTIGE